MWFTLLSLLSLFFVENTQARMLRQVANGIQCSSTPMCGTLMCGSTYCDPEVVVDKTTYNKTFGNGYLVLAGGYENNETGRCYSTSDCGDNSICSGCSNGSPLGVCVLLASEQCPAPFANGISCESSGCGEMLGTCQFPALPYYAQPNVYCDPEFNTTNSYYVVAGTMNGSCTSSSQCEANYICSSCSNGADTGVCVMLGTTSNGCDTLADNNSTNDVNIIYYEIPSSLPNSVVDINNYG